MKRKVLGLVFGLALILAFAPQASAGPLLQFNVYVGGLGGTVTSDVTGFHAVGVDFEPTITCGAATYTGVLGTLELNFNSGAPTGYTDTGPGVFRSWTFAASAVNPTFITNGLYNVSLGPSTMTWNNTTDKYTFNAPLIGGTIDSTVASALGILANSFGNGTPGYLTITFHGTDAQYFTNSIFDTGGQVIGGAESAPEPGSMILLGTGLLGIAGGLAARRRRRSR